MAHLFRSLGELGAHVESSPTFEVVDAPVPLSHYLDRDGGHGPVWRNQPSVRKVVGFIARQVASIPLNLYQRVDDGDRRRVRDNDLAKLLARPSRAPGEGPMRFWETVLIDGLLRDRWCVLVATHADGGRELVRFAPRHVRFVGDGLDRIEKIAVPDGDGGWDRMDPAGFLIDVGYSERGVNGTSPMVTLRHLLEEQREAIEYRRSVWRRGARIPGVIERPTAWPKDGKARENFRRSWQAFQSGGGREGGTPVLDEGMTYKELKAFSPADTGDLEGRRLSDAEVASAYWIAPELVGAREGNFSNMMAFKSMLYSVALGPYVLARDEAAAPLVEMFGLDPEEYYLESNIEAKLRGSFEEQAQALQSSVGAPYLTRNEARALSNRPAVAGGDDLVVPLNVLIGGQASPRDSGTQNLRRGPVRLAKSDDLTVQIKAEAREADATSIEGVLTAFFGRQEAAVLSRIGADAEGDDWWDEERWNTELAADLYALATTLTREIGRETLEALGIDPDGYSLGRTSEFLLAVADSRAGAINAATRSKILAALAGDVGEEALTSTPAGVFEEAKTSRATTAALTLATTLAGFAVTEAVNQTGRPGSEKTWVVNSASPRSSHAAMNGQTVPASEPFSNGAMWPGDPVLGADGVAGCLCSVIVTIQ